MRAARRSRLLATAGYAWSVEALAKALLGLAVLLALLGGGLLLAAKLGIGRLPGDVVIKRGDWTLYAPVGLMLAVSLLLTLLLNVFLRR